jgi:UDP-glucose 4-epimerase
MPRYLITGGAGFIGSHLADALLARGDAVRVLDDLSTGKRANLDPRAEFLEGDVADPEATTEAVAGTDGVFHLAAIASVQRANEDWLGTNRVNLAGTVTVLDAARRHGRVPVVIASSAAVYGDVGGEAAHESLHCSPRTAYGADKLASELHAAVGWLVHRVPTACLRFFNVYGARQDPSSPYSGVISIFTDRIAAGLPLTLHGGGTQTRDFVHVSDVVAHLLAAMRVVAAEGGALVCNACTGHETSIAGLAALLGRLHGAEPHLTTGPARAGDITRSAGDPTRAIERLGVRAELPLEAGLARLLKGQ